MHIDWPYILDSLSITLTISIPQMLVCTWFAMVWYGIKPERLALRLSLFSVIFSIYIDTFYLSLPQWAHLLNSFGSYYILLSLFFRELRPKTRLMVLATFYVISILLELAIITIVSYNGDFMNMIEHSLWGKIASYWPPFAILLALAIYFRQKNIHPSRTLYLFLLKTTSKMYFILFMLVGLQCIFFVLLFYWIFIEPTNGTTERIGFFLSITLFIGITVLIVQLISRARKEAEQLTQEAHVRDLMRLFTSVRGQRHDFINHLQVMHSMLSLRKYEHLKRYLNEVVQEIQSVNRFVRDVPPTALAALVKAKTAYAQEHHIDFIHPRLDTITQMHIKDIDTVRIAGHLIDYAFEIALNASEDCRVASLELYSARDAFQLKVSVRGESPSDDICAGIEELRRQIEPRSGSVSLLLENGPRITFCLTMLRTVQRLENGNSLHI